MTINEQIYYLFRYQETSMPIYFVTDSVGTKNESVGGNSLEAVVLIAQKCHVTLATPSQEILKTVCLKHIPSDRIHPVTQSEIKDALNRSYSSS